MNIPVFGGNYVDLIIILVLAYFISEAVRHGFWVILADFVSFLGALLLSFGTYRFLASFLRDNFSLSHSMSNAMGFLATAIIAEAVFGFILGHLISRLPKNLVKFKLGKFLGFIPSVGEGLILTAFVLVLLMGLPIKPSVKNDINDSKIGGAILQKTPWIERKVGEVFGGIIEDSLTYLTIKPGSRESVPISVERFSLVADEAAEREMFDLVNEERQKAGVAPLAWHSGAVLVSREHAKDMWERRYFGHVSPDGEDVGDRLDKAGINYAFAGENLALAPTVSTAHTGLMNSEGHRDNILEGRFKKVGIGVIDNGVYGKMFVQVFTD